jgi:Phage integrase family
LGIIAAQQRLKAEARQLWQEGDWVFTSEIGDPLNPNSDYHRWEALLRRAGVPYGRLHDARHTAATVLLILGVPERTVMGIMAGPAPRWLPATSTSPTRSAMKWLPVLTDSSGPELPTTPG